MSMGVILKPDENGNWGSINVLGGTSSQEFVVLQNAASALGNGTILDVSTYATLVASVSFTGTATVVFEVSVDGVSYDLINGYSLVSGFVNTQLSAVNSSNRVRFIVTGWKYFRARISAYTSGTVTVQAQCTSETFPFYDNTVNISSDGLSSSGYAPTTSAYLLGFNGTNYDRVKTINTGQLRTTLYNSSGLELNANQSLDGAAGTAFLSSSLSLFNGSSWDRFRNNLSGTALSSAARASNTLSSDITNFNHKGIVLFLNVSSASGTGGLQVGLQFKDVLSSTYRTVGGLPTAVTANGTTVIMYYPGIDAANTPSYYHQSILLPQVFRVSVTHGDASSYTYSVSYQMIL